MEIIPSQIHPSWHRHLLPLFQLPEIIDLKYRILPQFNFYPAKENIFRVFQMPLDQIKVVILGQDPYPNPEHATGLAFSVPSYTNIRTPPSMKVIMDELEQEYPGFRERTNLYEFRTLEHWFRQGVFLLNTALTVEHMNAGSHIKYWQKFIEGVIKIIGSENSPVWLLWGSKAKSYIPTIQDSEEFLVNEILTAPHPAAGLYSPENTFLGCNNFREANEILISYNKSAINW